MTRAGKILLETIKEHNSKHSQFYWFQFSKDETKLFVDMMNQYATELILADRKDAADKAQTVDIEGAGYCKVVDKDSILNRPLPEQITQK